MKQWVWIGKDGNYFLGSKIWGGGFYKNKKNGWVALNTKDNNLYYSMDYKTPVEKVTKWILAPKQNSLKTELLRVYNDPWEMEHGCNRQCKRVKKRLSLKNVKSHKKYLKKSKTRKGKIWGFK
jgi:hypothetical protein